MTKLCDLNKAYGPFPPCKLNKRYNGRIFKKKGIIFTRASKKYFGQKPRKKTDCVDVFLQGMKEVFKF